MLLNKTKLLSSKNQYLKETESILQSFKKKKKGKFMAKPQNLGIDIFDYFYESSFCTS